MKMEFVQQQLKEWGEVIITTAGGEVYELHLGDTTFDSKNRVIVLKAADSEYILNGDAIESIQKHLGHKEG